MLNNFWRVEKSVFRLSLKIADARLVFSLKKKGSGGFNLDAIYGDLTESSQFVNVVRSRTKITFTTAKMENANSKLTQVKERERAFSCLFSIRGYVRPYLLSSPLLFGVVDYVTPGEYQIYADVKA